MADCDGDGEYELIFYSTDDWILHCLDRYSDERPNWPIPLPQDQYHQALFAGGAVGDLDLDGTLEYITKSEEHVYVYHHDGTMMDGFELSTIEYPYFFKA